MMNRSFTGFFFRCSALALAFLIPHTVIADSDYHTGATAIQHDPPDYAPDHADALQVLTPSLSKTGLPDAGKALRVDDVVIHGGSVFSADQLQADIRPFLQRDLTAADIEEVRYRLTRRYVDQGYINSGAAIDGYDQDTRTLHIQLEEGFLKNIRAYTANGVSDQYVASRLALSAGPPFQITTLQERFLMLLDDPLIETLNGSVLPGDPITEGILDTEVTRRRPYRFNIAFDNHGSPNLGEHRGIFGATVYDLTGRGDALTMNYIKTRGNERGHIDFSIPLSPRDTRFHLLFERGDSLVVEEPINALDIKSDYEAYELGVTHPIINTLRRRLVLGLSVGQRYYKTKLLDLPFFSMNPDAVNGENTIAPLRFTQEWLDRDSQTVWTARSVFSLGLPALGATDMDRIGMEQRFFSWLVQNYYAKQVIKNRVQFIGRLDGQFSDYPLPSMEQLGIGGVSSVRGYRENTLIRDQALFSSLELRYTIPLDERYGRLESAVFTDYAQSWNKYHRDEMQSLHSVGLGLLWSFKKRINTELYWGHRLKTPPETKKGTTWQDDGIHFSVQFLY